MESKTRLVRLGLALSACLFAALVSPAQNREDARITFDRFEYNSVLTPEYQPKSYGQAASKQVWFQIYTQYTATGGRDGWLDEVDLNWWVLIRTPAGLFMLLPAKVSYVDVETNNTRHNAVMYIRPNFLRRYCERERISRNDVWIHVEASVGGQVVAREDYGRNPPAKNWWMAKDSRQVRAFEGALLSRDKTPFAPLDSDFYETIKNPSGR